MLKSAFSTIENDVFCVGIFFILIQNTKYSLLEYNVFQQ